MNVPCYQCGAEVSLPGVVEAEAYVCPTCRGELPARVGKYPITGFLGAGGVGRVYKGIHPDLNRPVAVKVIKPFEGGGREFVQRFVREVQLTAKLDHPGIVRVYDAGAERENRFLVMELVEGRSLKDVIEPGALDPKEALRLAREIARALHYAHEHGIIHRDIKPGNIFVDPQGRPRILDFGLARSSDDLQVTAQGQMLGTPTYMAPEQIDGKPDRRSDLYSLGATLYEMLAGRPPLKASTITAMIEKLRKETPHPPSRHRAGIGPTLDALCMKALAKDPKDRFQTAEEFAAAIDAELAGTPRVKPKRPLWVAAVVAIPLVVVAVWFRPRRKPPAPPPKIEVPAAARTLADQGHYRRASEEKKDPVLKVLDRIASTEAMHRVAFPGLFDYVFDLHAGGPLTRALALADERKFDEALRLGEGRAEPEVFVQGVIAVERGIWTGDFRAFDAWRSSLPVTSPRIRSRVALGFAIQGKEAEADDEGRRLKSEAPGASETHMTLAILAQYACRWKDARDQAALAEQTAAMLWMDDTYQILLRICEVLHDSSAFSESECEETIRRLDANISKWPDGAQYLARAYLKTLLNDWDGAAGDLKESGDRELPADWRGPGLLRDFAVHARRSREQLIECGLRAQMTIGLTERARAAASELLKHPKFLRHAHRALAILASHDGNEASFLHHLGEALKNGYSAADAREEGNFAAWRGHPKFEALLKAHQ